ncbi:phospholipase-like protein [Tanacetum coccineum]
MDTCQPSKQYIKEVEEKKVVVVLLLWWWCCCGCVVVVVVVVLLWWCCGGAVVVLWWWGGAVVVVWFCGGGVVLLLWLLFGSGVVLVNMENYEDDPVTLTCRSKLQLIKVIRKKFRNTFREELFRQTCFGWLLDLDDSQENCVLIHFMSCRQVERSHEDTVVVPLTYHVNGHYIEFGREEFCLITGLRFGPEFSDRYEVGPIPFRRLVFDSDTDGGHVTGQMLIDNINGEEFDNLHDEVAVAVCQLAVLHFVLLGRQLAHNIPDWWLRLIVDKKGTWEIYPWGTLVWDQLYGQLENANVVRAEKLYAAQNRPIPRAAKYTLSGFTWAFKTWILEVYNVAALRYYTHQQRYPRAVAWSKVTTFQRKFLRNFFAGARPHRRLRPDAFEAKAEWWVCSQEFFDGRIHEAPPIPTPVKLPRQYDVPKNVDPRYDELINSIKELQKKNEAHEKLLKKVYNFYQGQSKPKSVEVSEHYGLSDFDFSVLQNTEGLRQDGPKTFTTSHPGTPLQGFGPWSSTNQARPSVIPATPHIATPMSQQGFASWSSTNQARPSVIPATLHIATPMSQQGFPLWSSTNQARPSVIPATPHIATPMSQQGFPLWSSTNQAGPSQNHDVGVVNPDEMPRGIDLNSPVEDLVYMGSSDTDVYISLHNVDPNKYVNCMSFLGSPEPVFLDCGIKGFVLEEQFWRDLVPYVCKGGTSAMLDKSNKFVIETDFHLMGMLDGSSRPYPSWDDVDIVYMPINSGGNHWVTGVLNLRWSTIHVIDSLNNPHRRKQLIDHISKWTNVLNVLLEKAGHFERTGRRPYNFELVYNDGLEFVSPQQGNNSDCGVVTCWVIENLCKGQAPVLYNVDQNSATLEFKCVLGCTTVVVRILKNVAMISLRVSR